MTQLRLSRLLLVGGLGVLLQACPPPPPVENDSGVSCDGTIGCACVAGACTTGECLSGTCTDCRRGEAACICRANNTCNAGLRCTSGLCETCPAGTANCPCSSGNMCGTGLVCSSGTCVADTCVAGTASCPCRAGDPKCDGTQYCDGTNRCQACSNDVIGCPCQGGACAGATVCDTTTSLCRAPVTCAMLQANGMCGAHQVCMQPNGGDGVCVPMTCDPQFKWDGTACVACLSQDCANEPTCASGDGGLGDQCAAQHRECTQTGAVAACGACLSGYALNGTRCEAVPRCGNTTCAITEYCDSTGGMPQCLALPCMAGQAQGGTGVCSACNRTCTGEGFSGRIWPFRAGDDTCVCETLNGYYFSPANNSSAVLCDADNDGWVREEADAVRADVRALRPNARCNFQAATRVRLVDEYNVAVDILSCTNGLVKASYPALPSGAGYNGGVGIRPDGGLFPLSDGGVACIAPDPLLLLETLRNDTPGRPAPPDAPYYGSFAGDAGRVLEANELNSLTKGCVSTAGDYNDNRIDDINEVQLNPRTGPSVTANRSKLETFSYFMELDTSYFDNGVLYIQERTRCDAPNFPLRYTSPDGGLQPWSSAGDGGTATPYWRTCSRSRDTSYDQANPQPGFDYAQFGCDDTAAGCPIVPPPHPTLIPPTDPNLVLMRNHGLCDLNGGKPADGRWRGMNHHSQFKCVSVVAAAGGPSYERVQSDFAPADGGTGLTFNQCTAKRCATPGDVNCTKAQGTGTQTKQPVVNCNPVAGTVGSVGFASVNFRANGSYTAGCINEDMAAIQTYLCPYPEFSLYPDAGAANYGRYSCFGKGSNFLWGGPTPASRATLRWGPNSNNSVLRQ